jgi:toxin secretion/phage lysis holin
MKQILCSVVGVAGAALASAFGGWSAGLTTLVIFMAVDYLSGLIVAGVFHGSNKTDSGTLESHAGWKGLCRKVMTILLVWVAYRIDLTLGTGNYVRNVVIIGFVTNELISIVENVGLMGIPLPSVITNSIDALQKKAKNGNAGINAGEQKEE